MTRRRPSGDGQAPEGDPPIPQRAESESARFEAFEAANRSGGPCANCDWREGDGVRRCYYDPDFGAVTHQNRHPTGLSAEQAALYGAYSHPNHGKIYYVDDAAREADIARVLEDVARRNVDAVACARRFSRPEPELATGDKYIERARSTPTLAELPKGWHTTPSLKGSVHAAAAHPGCHGGGAVRELGPYHIGCTGCDVEVRLWEHGIDYDVG